MSRRAAQLLRPAASAFRWTARTGKVIAENVLPMWPSCHRGLVREAPTGSPGFLPECGPGVIAALVDACPEPAVPHRNDRSQRHRFEALARGRRSPARHLLCWSPVLGIANINWQAVGRELAAVGTAALSVPLRWLVTDPEFDATAWHRTPVVFVHGFLGDPTNFLAVRSHLAGRGVRNFASFSYRPRLDYQRLADELGCTIEEVCRATGSRHVDLVGHSLGGLVARYLTESRGRPFVRRLVTLAAPYYATGFPEQELAIFGAHDPLVVPPLDGRHGRIRVVRDAGHLGLLYHPAVLHEVARYLTRPGGFVWPMSAEEREAA